jgi:small-conductance mechanosensitive channel
MNLAHRWDSVPNKPDRSIFYLAICHLGCLFALMVALSYPATLFAETAKSKVKGATIDSAPVIIDGRVLFFVKGIKAYPAKRRAGEIADRLVAFAQDPELALSEIRKQEGEDATKFVGPAGTIMDVFDMDSSVDGMTIKRSTLTETILIRIREAITDYRNDRSPEVLLVRLGYAVGLTFIALIVVFGARWGFRKLSALVEHRVSEHLETMEAKSFNLIQANQLWRILRGAVKLSALALALFLTYLYVNAVLGLFPWTRTVAYYLFELIISPLNAVGANILGYFPNLVYLLIIILAFRYILKLLRAMFTAVHKESITLSGFEPEWSWPTYRLVRILVWAFGLVLAYPYIPGSDSDAFKGVTIFLGVLASIGSSSIISNIVAGYTMTYRRAFKAGNWVRFGDHVGEVTEMRLLVTHLRTAKNEEVIIPNSQILNNDVTNFSSLAKDKGLILHTSVGIGYEVPWRQVEAMLLRAAGKTIGISTNRQPFVLRASLGDFAINYELNVYVDKADSMPRIYSALHDKIIDVFNEYGVAIMTPAYERDPEEPKLVPEDQWYAEPATGPVTKER